MWSSRSATRLRCAARASPCVRAYYISPALSALLRGIPADELADRYPGHQAGLIGAAGLPSPDSLVIVVGRPAAAMSPGGPAAPGR